VSAGGRRRQPRPRRPRSRIACGWRSRI